jgi:hypothetical protein
MMAEYLIEKECLKCDACNHTGWKLVDKAYARGPAKDVLKYYKKYFGNEIKVRLRKVAK